jgi:pimeloyl-ACP methyl ester carboxylesterase
MKSSDKKIVETSQSVMISGQRLFYRVAGTGSPLVLLHGHGVAGSIWLTVIPFLAPYYQVFVVDLPGHGRSRFIGDWRLREIAPLLISWLQQMKLPPVGIIGHSMGGAVAIHLTASAPDLVNRLVLVNAAGLPLRAPLPTLAARAIGSFLQPHHGSYPPEVLRDHLLTSPYLLWQSSQEVLESDFQAELALLSLPTLIIWGERDLLLPITLGYELHAALPHAKLVTMPQCGHCPMLQPAAFSQIVLNFLQNREPLS